MRNLAKNYDPKAFEKRIYENWEKNGAFKAEIRKDKKPFTIVMPPPNITGQLHMGHALDQTLQDVLIRYKRMEGFEALWIPGSDHASIATEVKVVEKLRREEGLEKEDLGRETFLKRAWKWKELYGGRITEQCRSLGNSCDWDREKFTMDEGCNSAVKEFFVTLYEKGLIYRGNRLINWCPQCGTSLSDAEVDHEDKDGQYWYFKYPYVDGSGGIVIATSRPETMFADAAIAVHPDDDRYENVIGKKVFIPLTDREIPIIADIYPDPEKGSGAVKITPAHDSNDFEVGERHNLPRPVCIDFEAKMTKLAGKYEGMDRYECRKNWVSDLKEQGFLVKTENLEIPTGGCYRCNTVVEPMLSDQWFVKMDELAKPAVKAAAEGRVKHVPERFTKIYLHWLENIRDWCISRQLWWGHRIPAYYCQDCGEINVSREDVKTCKKCASHNIKQDEDVLDTWFSSGLWPVSTLGWPDKSEDFDYFYPTDVLVTGYDIIFFWIVRMVFSALEITGKEPFHTVYVHGLVRDAQGRKMSKSLGNGIDPIEVIDRVGADALRFMLISGITPGNDTRFSEQRLESARNFANKLWNASRFVIMNLQDEAEDFLPMEDSENLPSEKLKEEDKWLISVINESIGLIKKNMEAYELSLAAQKAEDLIWNVYCDWYIEILKPRLYGDNEEDKKVARGVLTWGLSGLLKLLHPFMPFITEEIWSYLPVKKEKEGNPQGFLMREKYPEFKEELDFKWETEVLERAMDIVKAVRNIRAEAEAAPGKKLTAIIAAKGRDMEIGRAAERQIKHLGNLTEIIYSEEVPRGEKDTMSAVVKGMEIFIPLEELVDFETEIKRLRREKKKLEAEVARVDNMLANPGFVNKAPEKKINEEKEKKKKYEDMLEKVTKRLSSLKEQLPKEVVQ